MGKTTIEWTDRTWSPVRGCSRVSEGCRHCYAERQAARFSTGPDDPKRRQGPFQGFVQITNGHPQWTGKVELIEKHLENPLHWRKPQRVFVNSMSDLFHEALPDEAIDRVFAVMALCPQHTFQVLTKRPERMRVYCGSPMSQYRIGLEILKLVAAGHYEGPIPFEDVGRQPEHVLDAGEPHLPLPNVWLGVSAEDQKTADERIPLLLRTPAAIRFVSYEPALGAVQFNQRGFGTLLDWIIVGGESGPGARPFDIAWARQTVAQCKAAGVACFVKQLGADPREANDPLGPHPAFHHSIGLKDRKGGDMTEWHKDLFDIRQFPKAKGQQ
jgi:protein gp37